VTPSVEELFGWALSGQGRLIAAAMLFIMIAVIERVPFVKLWLNFDGWKVAVDSADAWMTSGRKKLLANIILALGPTALLIVNGEDWKTVLMSAVSIALMAAGVNSQLSTLMPKVMDVKAKVKEEK
jgi:hypothetical protein